MHVDSYLEIFTTMYGWAFANIIGELLVGTGLFAVPFLIIAFQTWRQAKESAAAGAGSVGLSEAIQVKIILALFVFTFAFCTTPLATLANLSYTPLPTVTNPSPQTATVGSTNTTYDQAMPDVSSISSTGSLSEVPMWWYLVMQLSAGFNDSVRSGINAAAVNLRDIEALARMAAISDPKILANIQRFYSECYIPARSQYMRMDPSQLSAAGQAIVDPSNKDYGPTDVDWMGSKLFVTEQTFYPSMHSLKPVVGFAAAADEPNNANVGGGDATGTTSQYGWPTCLDWWMDSSAGVRASIVNQSSSTFQQLGSALGQAFTGSTDDERADAIARAAVVNSPPTWVDASHTLGESHADAPTRFVRNVGGAFGSLFTYFTDAATMMATMHMTAALAMIQALILLCIYMLLPLIVFLSGYKLEVMFYGAMAIFTVKVWTVLWFVAQWLDSNLVNAMYPNTSVMQVAKGIWDGSLYKGPILDILLFGMYVCFPLLWSGMMGWIGVHVGTALSQMMEKNSQPANVKTGMEIKSKI